MLRKVQALESENSVYDLDSLKKTLLRRALDYVRKEEDDCTDLDHDRTRSQRLDQIGFLLRVLGQAEDAIPILRRCMELDPDFATCPEQLGVAFLDLNRYPEAKEAFKKTIEIGGFSELNAQAITRARGYLEMMNRGSQTYATFFWYGVFRQQRWGNTYKQPRRGRLPKSHDQRGVACTGHQQEPGFRSGPRKGRN
jgi:tetratricopeptide (TPR) repeat protein